MNNLHRELAPISDSAWSQIEEETSRTIKRYLAGRRVVDVHFFSPRAKVANSRTTKAHVIADISQKSIREAGSIPG